MRKQSRKQRRGKQREGQESFPWILILPSKAEDPDKLDTDDSRDVVMSMMMDFVNRVQGFRFGEETGGTFGVNCERRSFQRMYWANF